MKNYYEILGIEENSTQEQIKKQYMTGPTTSPPPPAGAGAPISSKAGKAGPPGWWPKDC
jgi:hypothetical protein